MLVTSYFSNDFKRRLPYECLLKTSVLKKVSVQMPSHVTEKKSVDL